MRGEAAGVIFKTYSNGVSTSRDAWAYNFNRNALAENMSRMIDTYNEQVFKWEHRGNRDANVDDFVVYDDKKISWSHDLKLEIEKQAKPPNSQKRKGENRSTVPSQNQTYFLIAL